MEQLPLWEGNSFSASQETLCLLWNPNVYKPYWSLYQTRWIQSTPSHPTSLKIHSGIIFPSIPLSSKWPIPSRFLDQNVCISHPSYTCFMLCKITKSASDFLCYVWLDFEQLSSMPSSWFVCYYCLKKGRQVCIAWPPYCHYTFYQEFPQQKLYIFRSSCVIRSFRIQHYKWICCW
jgi:hypothetical protein